MTVEIINGADGGPMFKLIPENQSDRQFLAQWPVGVSIQLVAERVMMEGEGQWLSVREQ